MPQKSPRSPSHRKSTGAKSRAKTKVVSVIADLDPTHSSTIPMQAVSSLLVDAGVPLARKEADAPVSEAAAPKPLTAAPARPPEAPAPVTARLPRSLGGLLRKVAQARPGHGMLLKLADRVDVWEHRLKQSLPWSVPTAAVLVTGLMWRARRA